MVFGKRSTGLANFANIMIDNLSHCVIGKIEQQIFLQSTQTVISPNFVFHCFPIFAVKLERFLLLKKGIFSWNGQA
jgi:hypothetical protein